MLGTLAASRATSKASPGRSRRIARHALSPRHGYTRRWPSARVFYPPLYVELRPRGRWIRIGAGIDWVEQHGLMRMGARTLLFGEEELTLGEFRQVEARTRSYQADRLRSMSGDERRRRSRIAPARLRSNHRCRRASGQAGLYAFADDRIDRSSLRRVPAGSIFNFLQRRTCHRRTRISSSASNGPIWDSGFRVGPIRPIAAIASIARRSWCHQRGDEIRQRRQRARPRSPSDLAARRRT